MTNEPTVHANASGTTHVANHPEVSPVEARRHEDGRADETGRNDEIDHTEEAHRSTAERSSAGHSSGNYWRFGAMILTSMAAMFALTYTNSYALDHVRWSETRFYMTFVMGAAMAVIMLGFMLGMYRNRMANGLIFVGAAIVFGGALWLVRSQTTVDDRSYMRAMIPHHSIAILTSERAEIEDQRVRELADAIIEAQRREIEEMDWLIADIAENGPATTPEEAEARPVPDFTVDDTTGRD